MDPRTEKAKLKYEGKVFFTKEGTRQFIVNKFNSGADIEIQFLGTELIRHISSYDLGKGISDPFKSFKGSDVTCPVIFMDSQKELMGNYYRTNEGYMVQVIRVDSKSEVTVKFLDEFGYEFTTTIQNIRKGEVKNPYHKNQFGGYLGEGPYNSKHPYYKTWYNVILRGSEDRNEYYVEHHGHYSTETYMNTIVCQEWLCFNTFAIWYNSRLAELNPNFSYEIDKDLLYPIYSKDTGGKKLYSPFTVELMPHDLNNAIQCFNNMNSNTNMKGIIDRAQYYYTNNAITSLAYNIIMKTCNDIINNR